MNYDLGLIVTRLGTFQAALSCEPDVRPNLSGLTFAKLPVILLALMNLGYCQFQELIDYLDEHGASFDLDEVFKVLYEFRSAFRHRDGRFDGLWRGDVSIGFTPNISVSS